MSDSQYSLKADDSVKRHWFNQTVMCSYRNEAGRELGYVEAGHCRNKGMWYPYLHGTPRPLRPEGLCDIEEAKRVVEQFVVLDEQLSDITTEFDPPTDWS